MHELDIVGTAHKLLLRSGATVATAESCTAGLLAAALTHNSGSSVYYIGGVNAYANEAKTKLVGVDAGLLRRYGAVSAEVAEAMASGIRDKLGAKIGIALTGVAGPGGGTLDKPVGTVWLGFAAAQGVSSHLLKLSGERTEVREKAILCALQHLIEHLEKHEF